MRNIPFPRTTCACRRCIEPCTRQPGHLIPGQLETIAAHLGQTLPEARAQFWASPGALVLMTDTGIQRQIGTITPKLVCGRCVFLDQDNRCRIHPVSPFGCAYFDTHMRATDARPRSVWGLQLILSSPDYQTLRAELPIATSYAPRGY